MHPSRSFHIITFGCQMNEHDSERMAGILEGQGYSPSSTPEDADVIILNTCSIREKAEQKFYSELGRLSLLEGKNGHRPRIAVAGCIAQQEGKRILARSTAVDLVIGPSDIRKIRDLVDRAGGWRAAVVETGGDPDYHLADIPASRTDGLKAWVSIMYGCDNFCTYCVVPYLRGRERSRPVDDILREVRALAEEGYREITLLGQNVNSYGKGLRDPSSFPDLLRSVHAVTGIERIRFVTSHPRDLSDDLIAAMRDLSRVCKAIHLPVQSGSDRVLAAMHRRYTAGEFRDKVRRLRTAVPGIAITTDIIAGFPGETFEDHEQTLALLRDVKFDNAFAFKYSRRPHTKALDLPDHLSEQVKDERLAAVLDLQRALTLRKHEALVGREQLVLVEGRSKRGGTLSGRTEHNRIVNFPGPEGLDGTIRLVRITGAGPNALTGELCG
jgi:tRNA-2-methylthio-N6-dimethylallyladenosine synthase